MFSSGSWNIIGNLVDWYIISSRDGLSRGNNMVWLAREKVSTTDSIPSFHFKYESFTKLCDSPVGSYLDGITSLNIYKSESERLSYIYAPRYKRYKAENLGLFPWPEANGPVEW